MRNTIYIVLSILTFLSCKYDSGLEESLSMKNLTDTIPSVTLLPGQYDNMKASYPITFHLGMKVILPAKYEINFAYYEMVDKNIPGLHWTVGGGTFDYEDFNQDEHEGDYHIYRGGEFEIRAKVSLNNVETNVGSVISSSPISMKVLYPNGDDILQVLNNDFSATWTSSLEDPGKKEYGYYIILQEHVIKKGELSRGDANLCSSLEQNVLLTGSFSPVSNNPTSPEYKAQEYLIGLFHTHPTLYGCGNATRNPGASQKDIDSAAVREFGLPGFVYDYMSFVDTNLPINANAKIYKYGAPGRFPNTY